MPNGPVVVDLAFRLKESPYFELFELTPRFEIKPSELSRRYLALSRALHPDHFSQEPDVVKRAAQSRYSEFNEAYEVLKDDVKRRDHLLDLWLEKEGSDRADSRPEFKDPLVMEWAEEWFELQDLQDPERGNRITILHDRLVEERALCCEKMGLKQTEFDHLLDQQIDQRNGDPLPILREIHLNRQRIRSIDHLLNSIRTSK